MTSGPRTEPGFGQKGAWMESERQQLRGLRKGGKISKREREREIHKSSTCYEKKLLFPGSNKIIKVAFLQ